MKMQNIGKRLTAGLLGAALVMSMPFASALTQKNITVGRGVTIYVDDQKINPGDANGNPVEPMLYNGTTYLPIRAVSTALNVPIAWDGTTSSAYLGEHKVDQNAVNRAKAYVSVIEQLQSKYGKRAVSGSIVSGLVTAMLIDFDGDGNDELLCVCNTKDKIPEDQWGGYGTNASSKYLVYSWNGFSAVKLVEKEVAFSYTQNDSRHFARRLRIGSRNGIKYVFCDCNGELLGDSDALFVSSVETLVDGEWKTIWGIHEYETWYGSGNIDVKMKDALTGGYIDVDTGWNEFDAWNKNITAYQVTFSSLTASGHENDSIDKLAPAPEIALSKLKAIANSQSSILGG